MITHYASCSQIFSSKKKIYIFHYLTTSQFLTFSLPEKFSNNHFLLNDNRSTKLQNLGLQNGQSTFKYGERGRLDCCMDHMVHNKGKVYELVEQDIQGGRERMQQL